MIGVNLFLGVSNTVG